MSIYCCAHIKFRSYLTHTFNTRSETHKVILFLKDHCVYKIYWNSVPALWESCYNLLSGDNVTICQWTKLNQFSILYTMKHWQFLSVTAAFTPFIKCVSVVDIFIKQCCLTSVRMLDICYKNNHVLSQTHDNVFYDISCTNCICTAYINSNSYYI